MSRAILLVTLTLTAAPLPATARLATKVKSSPSPIVLGQAETVVIEVTDLPGAGPVKAGVNVGKIGTLHILDDRARITYQPPGERFPQRLCLLLVRIHEPDRVYVARLPLLARTRVPITTRRNSQVTLTIGDQVFGPQASGPRGKLEMPVVVPPGVTEGEAVAVGAKGMETRKKVEIRQKAHNALAMVVTERPGPLPPLPRFEISLASADPLPDPPRLEAAPEWSPEASEAPVQLALSVEAEGRWSAAWAPDPGLRRGRWTLRAWAPSAPTSELRAVIALPEKKKPTPPAAPKIVKPAEVAKPPPGFFGRLRWSLSLAAGMLHNTSALTSPRLTVEAGADHPLGRGRIGARLLVSTSWSSQEIPVEAAETSLPPASTRVVLVPIGALVTYRVPLGLVSPYAAAGVMAQLVHTDSSGEDTGERNRLDAVFGVIAMVGARLELGPGGAFLQAGYQHSRVDNDAVKLLAGGVLVEAGYRLELGR